MLLLALHLVLVVFGCKQDSNLYAGFVFIHFRNWVERASKMLGILGIYVGDIGQSWRGVINYSGCYSKLEEVVKV